MDHSLPLISTLALAFGLALIFGYLAERLKFPALVGYLFAGIACSGHTPGPVADAALAGQLSELGVILLMFGVGLHFSIQDLLKVRRIAVPGAILQMTIATVLGSCFAHWSWHWDAGASLIFGLCLSCASTVVLLKALELHGHLNTIDGQISVGWLVVEDLATVVILVMLPPVAQILSSSGSAEPAGLGQTLLVIGSTLLRVAAFVAIMLVAGRKIITWALRKVARTGSRELFTLFVLFASIGIAFGAAMIFDVSFALGAFFAGMVLRESPYARRAAHNSLPLQDAFSVLFFVGVGMMLDWHVLFTDTASILTMLAIIVLGKSITAFLLVHFLRYPLHTSLNVGAALAQIGEFSFILAAQGVALGMVGDGVLSMIVAASILSIALNPLMFRAVPVLRRLAVRHFAWARTAAMVTDPYSVLPRETPRRVLAGQTILIGSGDVTHRVTSELKAQDIPTVSVVEDPGVVEAMRKLGLAVIGGDPSDPMVLVQAHIVTASVLVITDLDAVKALKTVEMARQLNPQIQIYVRAHSGSEAEQLRKEGVENVWNDAESISDFISSRIVRAYAPDDDDEEESGSADKPEAAPAGRAAQSVRG